MARRNKQGFIGAGPDLTDQYDLDESSTTKKRKKASANIVDTTTSQPAKQDTRYTPGMTDKQGRVAVDNDGNVIEGRTPYLSEQQQVREDYRRAGKEKGEEMIEEQLAQIQESGRRHDENIDRTNKSYGRAEEDLDTKVDRALEDNQRQLEEYNKQVRRNIDDVEREANRQQESLKFFGALSGANKSSLFSVGLTGLRQDADRLIGRLKQDLGTREEDATIANTRIKEDYEKGSQRLLDDWQSDVANLNAEFAFNTRAFRDNLVADANSLVEKYGLSSEKLGKRLQELGLSAMSQAEQAYGQYVTNMRNTQNYYNDQVDHLIKMRNLETEEQKELVSQFTASSGNRSLDDLQLLIDDGVIDGDYADQIISNVKQTMIDTIDTNLGKDGIGTQFLDEIEAGLAAGKTPNEVLADIAETDQYQQHAQSVSPPETTDVYNEKGDRVTMVRDPVQQKYTPLVPESTKTKQKGGLQDLTQYRSRDGSGAIEFTGNVGNDLNNPGNLTRGGSADQYAIGYVNVVGNDGVPRDFLVFANREAGYAGVQADLEAKMTGSSRYVQPTDSLDKLLDVWVGGDGAGDGYKSVVKNATGYNLKDQVKSLSPEKVLEGIKQAEGATDETGHDYSALAQQAAGVSELDFSEQDIPLYAKYRAGKMTSHDWNLIEDVDQFKQEALAHKKYLSAQPDPHKERLIDIANELLNGKKFSASLGGVPYTKSKDYRRKFNYLTDNLTMDKLLELKASGATFGALSNEELTMIANAASPIALDTTREEYDSILTEIIVRFGGDVEIEGVPEIEEEAADSGAGSTVTSPYFSGGTTSVSGADLTEEDQEILTLMGSGNAEQE